jgi:hypothetical protein
MENTIKIDRKQVIKGLNWIHLTHTRNFFGFNKIEKVLINIVTLFSCFPSFSFLQGLI